MESLECHIKEIEDGQFPFAQVNSRTFNQLSVEQAKAYIIVDQRHVLKVETNRSIAPKEIGLPRSYIRHHNLVVSETLKFQAVKISAVEEARTMTIEVIYHKGPKKVWTQAELKEIFLPKYQGEILSDSMPLEIPSGDDILRFSIRHITTEEHPDWETHAWLTSNTILAFNHVSVCPLLIINDQEISVLNQALIFEKLGIGGMEAQERTFNRRVIATRQIPHQQLKELGVNHLRGILLYGPPGTGKTLIARQLATALKSRPPKIVTGPEILNRFVGESERKLRELFADAEEEQRIHGDCSMLHVIIFDEIDALCQTRGTHSNGVSDNIVNQFLSKLDGVNSLNNLLVIGMTNRLDLIDPAVLRPGRLELHIEVGLPDQAGRQQILRIHTATMSEYGHLHPSVDLAEIAHDTVNYTGAECQAVVNSASSFAIERGGMDIKVTAEDFAKGVKEVKPAHGQDEILRECEPLVTEEAKTIAERASFIITNFRQYKPLRQLNLLITGVAGSGKTALALNIAKINDFPCVKVISHSRLLGLTESGKVQYIMQAFEEALKSTESLVILDDLESLVEYVGLGNKLSVNILQVLRVKLTQTLPEGRSMVLLATSTSEELLRSLGLLSKFHNTVEVHRIESKEDDSLFQAEAFIPA